MHLIVLVIDCPEKCSELLRRWEEEGAGGITILESMGVGRLQTLMRDDLPLMPSLRDLLSSEEIHHRTVFTVVPDEATVDRIVAVTEAVLGDMLEPNSGFMFVVPVSRSLGLRKSRLAK